MPIFLFIMIRKILSFGTVIKEEMWNTKVGRTSE